MLHGSRGFVLLVCALGPVTGCNVNQPATPASPAGETADEFVARVNEEMRELGHEGGAAGFVHATYLTPDSELLEARSLARYLSYLSQAVEEAKKYRNQDLAPATKRALDLLRLGVSAPAPTAPERRAELTSIKSRLEGLYGAAKVCQEGSQNCREQEDFVRVMASSRDYEELLEAWQSWHTISRVMRPDYERFVELANEGARELGFADLGAMWRSGYDMPPEEFERTTASLWQEVRPLYVDLHCYVRQRLQTLYGAERVPSGRPIPAHLLGNLWAQQWDQIFDLVEPYPGSGEFDLTAALERQHYDGLRITRAAESFYVSLGFPRLPQTFWERSMFSKPRDREVQCHASAWNIDNRGDVRIKQCLQPTQRDLETSYHELGHVYYYLAYVAQPYVFQGGAHDGFHEAVGDTVNLSMTPEYLASVGLIEPQPSSPEAVINHQMRLALDKIAFLPFGKLIDEWRWRVFSGEIGPGDYNAAWWRLREEYQGVAAPLPRTEEDFDAGAKYHVPNNTPYTRYFLSIVLQFQFHRALCAAAGYTGPLHECSIYGSKRAGEKLWRMLEAGQSRPWPEIIEELTGGRTMDASAIIEYFQPLIAWLKQRNEGQQCGW